MIEHLIIEREEVNTPTVTSLYFKWDKEVLPGQFVMVWIPTLGEVPMSLSKVGLEKSLTVKAYGPSTQKLIKSTVGDTLFIRGPYGVPFSNPEGKNLLIGGGSGMASLRPLINKNSTGIIASKSAEELLFTKEFMNGNYIEVTEDGTRGMRGIITDGIDQVDVNSYTNVYVCGPERMLKAVYEKLKDCQTKVEFSLERSMKCGIGICDSCSIDGFQICLDGPTFSLDQVKKMVEFGVTKLSSSGKRVYF
jgi:dihydroorotate dehydrogenase electron transfer subunit